MSNPARPVAFILASTDHGTLILNRFDQVIVPGIAFGAGYQLLNNASYDPQEVALMLHVLELRRKYHGDGLFAVDCGANLGVHTVEWAKYMTGWGTVLAFEAQERIYYALAGNVAINNCFNARVVNAAVSSRSGMMKIPQPNYLANASFGSLELKKFKRTEFIGQAIDYSEDKMVDVPMVHLDAFNFRRLDLLKIDVEGMELEVIEGAAKCISKYRPIMFVETLKTDVDILRARLASFGYLMYPAGINVIAFHKDDTCMAGIRFTPPEPAPVQAASAA
ncbi:MAG TPA: FkbM family methyltransferase [Xanthobacteraceae bacterium]|nr:FkbM family methyltransferase [Xanthobacteraceae bacterium]